MQDLSIDTGVVCLSVRSVELAILSNKKKHSRTDHDMWLRSIGGIVVVCILLCLLMRLSHLSAAVTALEHSQGEYLTQDEYRETFTNLLDQRLAGHTMTRF